MAVDDTLQGTRYEDVPNAFEPRLIMEPGGYRRVREAGEWHWEATTPNGLGGNLKQHEVEEHEDGTITVSPSILVETPGAPDASWHGYLERGTWREV